MATACNNLYLCFYHTFRIFVVEVSEHCQIASDTSELTRYNGDLQRDCPRLIFAVIPNSRVKIATLIISKGHTVNVGCLIF